MKCALSLLYLKSQHRRTTTLNLVELLITVSVVAILVCNRNSTSHVQQINHKLPTTSPRFDMFSGEHRQTQTKWLFGSGPGRSYSRTERSKVYPTTSFSRHQAAFRHARFVMNRASYCRPVPASSVRIAGETGTIPMEDGRKAGIFSVSRSSDCC